MKMKLAVLVTLSLGVIMGACGSKPSVSSTEVETVDAHDAIAVSNTLDDSNPSGAYSVDQTVSDAAVQMLKGTVQGDVGKTYRTQWFEFTIKSIEKIDVYAAYTPRDGFDLYGVWVNEKNTFTESIPMGTVDYYMDADNFLAYIYPMAPLDDTMMPLEFDLEVDESVEYYMLFEVPADTEGLRICYTEINVNEDEGAQFVIAVN